MQRISVLPDNYRTLPTCTALAALARLAGREKESVLLDGLLIVGSHYLYHLNYVTPVIGEPPMYKDITHADRHRVISTIQNGHWKKDEMWIKEMLSLWTHGRDKEDDFQRICHEHVEFIKFKNINN